MLPRHHLLTAAILLVSIFYITTQTIHAGSIDIHINEIGAFETTGLEWIEIVNNGSETIDLTGWKFIEDNTNHGLTLVQGTDSTLGINEYAIIAQDANAFITKYPDVTARVFDSSWGTLNESGEKIGLRDNTETVVEEFTYMSATDFSLERKQNTPDYTNNNWLEHPNGNTAGLENYWSTQDIQIPIDTPPTAVIIGPTTGYPNSPLSFDANQSTDDVGISAYSWDFGDETTQAGVVVEKTYSNTGTYTITLTVTDNALQIGTATQSITINQQTTSTDTQVGGFQDVRINEIVSDPQTENEWIELYNNSSSIVSLASCTIADGVGNIATITETIDAGAFLIIEIQSSKLNNGGDIVKLICGSEIIDFVSYGDWDDENKTDNAPTPQKGESIIRYPDGSDTNNDSIDWQKTTTLTKNSQNISTNNPATPPTPPSGNTKEEKKSYAPSTIVINEFVSDPTDGETEFIELYNRTATVVDLSGWYIEDGSEAKTTLSGSIVGYDYVIIESPKGQLNNAGDKITLYDPTSVEIDAVTYGKWDDGNINDNAPAPPDPYSLARKTNGQDADNDLYDFIKTDTITKGKSNIITDTANPDNKLATEIVSINTKGIVINEIYPNPPGSDNDDEFVELKNIGTETVSIAGWKLNDSSTGKDYIIVSETLAPNSIITIYRKQSGIALNNSGGEDVQLSLSNGVLVTKTSYTGSVTDGMSYSRTAEGTYVWSTVGTPNKENIIATKNNAPKVLFDADTNVVVGEVVSFDASDTTDSETDTLTFSWNFGDGETDTGEAVEHVYTKRGVYTATLIVTDTQKNIVEKRIVITVRDEDGDDSTIMSVEAPKGLYINEFLPNPKGAEDSEFIELYNDSENQINLGGLKLDDEDGGSRPYIFDDDTFIEPKEYRVFSKQETKLALNNTNDSVRILAADNTPLLSIDYENVIEGASYGLNSDKVWQWSTTLTPGEKNSDVLAKEKITKKTTSKKKVGAIIDTTLEKIREEDIGDRVRVSGVVAVLPDVFGTQYFYIVNTGTEKASGIQVYSYKKDFPRLSVGDVITVVGELSESSGETRLKTQQKEDMIKNDENSSLQPMNIETTEIGESFEGGLISVYGEITEKKASYLYIDDGVGEIKIYFKKNTGLKGSDFEIGQKITVSGILGETRSGYQLMPRDSSDIVYEQNYENIQTDKNKNTSSVAETYLTATAGGLTSILIGLFAKARGTVIIAFLKRVGKIATIITKIKKG